MKKPVDIGIVLSQLDLAWQKWLDYMLPDVIEDHELVLCAVEAALNCGPVSKPLDD
ncbi:hypothetical protein YDYSY3_22150 [Paenibacillus chitinolyticus]|uniref:hypothetical protein n=1 Tax=Paenibacillus chitinolyticus TaxID=79263 RepID=UPI0026E4DE70|nr:hypothetical protein [Paenibacillus chitinolyticus]GKS11215.1 hypothetical protein YDYSY3_22150 [Paenibacillus chitinolyticus]